MGNGLGRIGVADGVRNKLRHAQLLPQPAEAGGEGVFLPRPTAPVPEDRPFRILEAELLNQREGIARQLDDPFLLSLSAVLPFVRGKHDCGVVGPEEAFRYYKQTGQHLGRFSDPQSADAYARALHEQQATEYVRTSDKLVDVPPGTARVPPDTLSDVSPAAGYAPVDVGSEGTSPIYPSNETQLVNRLINYDVRGHTDDYATAIQRAMDNRARLGRSN